MKKILILSTTLMVLFGSAVFGQTGEIKMSNSPIWQITANRDFPCGVGWADLDGNGWLDLVVSNGVDVTGRYVAAYFNGPGGLSDKIGWQSRNIKAFDNLCLGDLDNDGDPDLLVSILGLGGYGFPPERHVIYLNDNGLSRVPSWSSAEGNSFSCAIGDPDGDGDLDIAFAQGTNSIQNPDWCKNQKGVMYTNNGGSFDTIPSWQTDLDYHTVDVAFADIDRDGDHDLALSGRGTGIAIFYNHDGVIETSPSWQTQEIVGGRQIAFGDVDGDGYQDLAAAGIGTDFYLFKNNGGTLEKTPSWTCSLYNQPSAVAWADVDGDGDLDLAGCGWYSHLGIFENVDGVLSDTYRWTNASAGLPFWSQQIAFADYDEDMLVDTVEMFQSDDKSKLIYAAHKPLHEIKSVELNGSPLPLTDYCCDPAEGWLSLKTAPAEGDNLSVVYTYSNDLDLAITSNFWCSIYENQNMTDKNDIRVLLVTDSAYGANYNIHDQKGSIRKILESYGWNMDIAAPSKTVQPCPDAVEWFGLTPFPSDLLTGDLDWETVKQYDAIVLLPNKTGQVNNYDDQRFVDLLTKASESGIVVAGWCRTVRILAKAGLLDGRQVVGHADYAAEYETAGATFLGNDHPPVIDGNIVTIVRSKFYREEGCQAIANAIVVRRVSR